MKLDIYAAGLVNEAARRRNEDRVKDGETPCLLCGKGVKDTPKTKYFWLHGGGGTIITSEQDAEDLGGRAADLGGYPIGPECYRTHKEVLEPFTTFAQDIP